MAFSVPVAVPSSVLPRSCAFHTYGVLQLPSIDSSCASLYRAGRLPTPLVGRCAAEAVLKDPIRFRWVWMNNTRRVFSRVLNIGCRSCSEFAQYIGSVSTVVYLVVPSKHSKQYHSLLERPDNTFECAFICTLQSRQGELHCWLVMWDIISHEWKLCPHLLLMSAQQ